MREQDAPEKSVPSPSREKSRERDQGRERDQARERRRIRRMVEGELLPRLLLTHHAGPLSPSLVKRAEEALPHPRLDDFLKLVRSDESDGTIREFLAETVERGDSVEGVLAELLAPVARRMGELWEEDECDFVEVTVVCNRLQRAVRRLATQFQSGAAELGPAVLVTGLPNSQHTLGLLMLAETLARDGFDVALGEPFVPGVDAHAFRFVALSVTRSDEADAAVMMVHKLHEKSPDAQVIVGGAAFREDPSLLSRVGADGWAQDAQAACGLLREMFGRAARPDDGPA